MTDFYSLCSAVKANDLYEYTGSKSWIRDIILQYNQYGFLTLTSQPGKICNYGLFTSEYARHHNIMDDYTCHEDLLSQGKIVNRQQRAYIRGYMMSDMAQYLMQALQGHEYLYMRTSYTTKNIPHPVKVGSIIFINDQPVYNQMPDEDYTLQDDNACSFDLYPMLHRPINKIYDLPELYDISNILEVDIVDLRWNCNDDLWSTVLNLIYKYHGIDEI